MPSSRLFLPGAPRSARLSGDVTPVRNSGFTLIEVLLATAISAVVIVAIQAVYFNALRLRNTTSERTEADLALHRALDIVERDLTGLMLPGGTLSGTLQTDLSLGLMSTVAGEKLGPDFYTASGRIDAWTPFAEVQRVSYYLSPSNLGSGGTGDLVRSVSRNLLPALEDTSEEVILLQNITLAGFEFFDGYEWTQTWDSTTSATVPTAIRFFLQRAPSEDGAAAPEPVELVVPVLVALPATAAATLAPATP